MTFLDYLKTASPRIPGHIDHVISSGDAFLKTSLLLPLESGGRQRRFFVSAGDAERLSEGQPVLFTWMAPGRPGQVVEGKRRAPRASDVVGVSAAERDRAHTFLVAVRDLTNGEDDSQRVADAIERLGEASKYPAHTLAVAVMALRTLDAAERAASVDSERVEALSHRREALQTRVEELELQAASDARALAERQAKLRSVSEVLYSLLEADPDPTDAAPSPSQAVDLPTLAEGWLSSAPGVPALLAHGLLLGLASAAITGSVVLLHGPVGAGKTSSIGRIATALGLPLTLAPVRPAWVEPADVLGFFDPMSNVFRPGPLTAGLRGTGGDCPEIVCLDELNLARIENYLSDLLSVLERPPGSQDPRSVELYPPGEYRALVEELTHIEALGSDLDAATARRGARLRACLGRTPARASLPEGLVLAGTLNADETTYRVSPKVIDRSYCLLFPPADLVSPPLKPPERVGQLHFSALRASVLEALEASSDTYAKAWEDLVGTLRGARFSGVGIPLSHRLRRDHGVLSATAEALGLAPEWALRVFLWARLLPRIEVAKTDEARSVCTGVLDRFDALAELGEDRAWAFAMANLRRQLIDPQEVVVSYWHGTSRAAPEVEREALAAPQTAGGALGGALPDDDDLPF